MSEARTFRKKPVEIQAMHWTPESSVDANRLADWLDQHGAKYSTKGTGPQCVLVIETIEGAMNAAPGWWVIRGVHGEFYPCKPDIFEQTYEPVDQ